MTRVEEDKVNAMLEDSKESLAASQPAAPAAAGPLQTDPIAETIEFGDFAKLDLRVVRIRKAAPVEKADNGDCRVKVGDKLFTVAGQRRAVIAISLITCINGNPGEALLLAEEHAGEIHLLLSDIVMPLMSGVKLADRLCETRPDVRVILMAG